MTNQANVNENAEEVQNDIALNKNIYELANVDGIGTVMIEPGVIALVVKETALGVDGVLRLAPSGLVEGIADVFSKRTYDRSISIENADGKVIVTLVLILIFGCRIPEVAAVVKASVKNAIEEQVGAVVGAVNIVVKGLDKVDVTKDEEPTADVQEQVNE